MNVVLTTSMGAITLELDAKKAPKTVENFVAYVKAGHYDGTIFHRVMDNFMIQGGGFNDKMVQKPTKAAIKNEADNGLKMRSTPSLWPAPMIPTRQRHSFLSMSLITSF